MCEPLPMTAAATVKGKVWEDRLGQYERGRERGRDRDRDVKHIILGIHGY